MTVRDRQLRLLQLLGLLIVALSLGMAVEASAAELDNPLPFPLPVTVDGLSFVVAGKPLRLDPGSNVCVAKQVFYTGESSRLVFQGWLVDGVLVEGLCLEVPEDASRVEPYYVTEFMVVARSNPPGIVEVREWVRAGDSLVIDVPLEVEEGDARYLFSRVDGPGRLTGNRLEVPVASPTTVTLVYDAYYRVVVKLSDYGFSDEEYWLKAREESVVRVQGEISIDEGSKLILVGVEAAGAEARLLGNGRIAVIPRQGGSEVYPVYEVHYRVTWRTLEGPREVWVKQGEAVTLTAQQRVPAAPDPERVAYVFQGWKGTIESSLPTLTIIVDKPIDEEAVYKKMYKVTVEGPFQPREFWVEEGGSIPVYQPDTIPGLILGRKLTGYIVGDRIVPPGPGGVLLLRDVREPLTIVPVYEVTIMWSNVALLAGLVFAVVVLYMGYDLFMTLREERRARAAEAATRRIEETSEEGGGEGGGET